MWMFCEGLYLHTLIVLAFTTGNKLMIACYLIGWGQFHSPSVGIDLKELGQGQMSKCLKFCPGIKILNRFSLKNERL